MKRVKKKGCLDGWLFKFNACGLRQTMCPVPGFSSFSFLYPFSLEGTINRRILFENSQRKTCEVVRGGEGQKSTTNTPRMFSKLHFFEM